VLTRCPYKDCSFQWDYSETESSDFRSSNGFYRSHCPECSRKATLKPIEVWRQLERKVVYLEGKGCLSGSSEQSSAKSDEGWPEEPVLHVVLEDIRSLHNVGSIFRTSDAFGFRYLHLCGITGTPDRKDVKKTSLSAESNVEWKYYMSAVHAVAELKELGFKVISLECSDSSVDISELTPEAIGNQPLCLVLGNEVSGVSEEILAVSNMICHIPMRGIKESLNVSVAFGVAAFSISNLLRKACRA
jgi:23S rRNA (guanosine2251-2'-O)-methyltransferase